RLPAPVGAGPQPLPLRCDAGVRIEDEAAGGVPVLVVDGPEEAEEAVRRRVEVRLGDLLAAVARARGGSPGRGTGLAARGRGGLLLVPCAGGRTEREHQGGGGSGASADDAGPGGTAQGGQLHGGSPREGRAATDPRVAHTSRA